MNAARASSDRSAAVKAASFDCVILRCSPQASLEGARAAMLPTLRRLACGSVPARVALSCHPEGSASSCRQAKARSFAPFAGCELPLVVAQNSRSRSGTGSAARSVFAGSTVMRSPRDDMDLPDRQPLEGEQTAAQRVRPRTFDAAIRADDTMRRNEQIVR